MRASVIYMLLFTLSILPQNQNKSALFIADKTSYKLDKENNSLPVWIAASRGKVDSVHLDVPNIIAWDGRVKKMGYEVATSSAYVPVSTSGKLFTIEFNRADFENLDSGKYTLIMVISGAGIEPVKESLSFEVIPEQGSFVWMEETVSWIQTNFFLLS
jgi:hypothetical protein